MAFVIIYVIDHTLKMIKYLYLNKLTSSIIDNIIALTLEIIEYIRLNQRVRSIIACAANILVGWARLLIYHVEIWKGVREERKMITFKTCLVSCNHDIRSSVMMV